jgi:Beta-glucan synthesis-associated protein SKN1/KRE6/Sbg1
MRVDYIRVYQLKDKINYGCDPDGFPTEAYINKSVLFISRNVLEADLSLAKLS